MELIPADVFVVSIQGRGHGIAADLKRRGLNVTLIDLTNQMGVWPAEDQEGPFGFFKTDQFTSTFLESINIGDPYQVLEKGWTFWTEKGPLEMKGPTTQYVLNKWGWSEPWIQSLSHDKPSLDFYDPQKGLGALWPLVMSHVIASTYELKSTNASQALCKLPVAADFSVRFSTRQGHEKSLKWLKNIGVQVSSDTEILDLALLSSSKWAGFELKGEYSGVQQAPSFVWTLTSEETMFYSEKIHAKIFNKSKQEPVWSWVRYRVRLPEIPEVQVLPLHFAMVGDENEPWTHDNLILVQRTSSLSQFDFWLKIPNLQRFNKEYLTYIWNKILNRWSRRKTRIEPSLVSQPQEFYYTYEELGPSPFPVFDKKIWIENNKNNPAKNARLHSPEQWQSYNWSSIFERQQMIANEIFDWWKEEQIRKEKKRDREIHSS